MPKSVRHQNAANIRWSKRTVKKPAKVIDPCHTIKLNNHLTGTEDVYIFHPGEKSGSYRIDLNGTHWKTCGFTEAMIWIRKVCKRMPKIEPM